MLKLSGSILLIFGSGIFGFLKALALKRRQETLNQLLTALGLLETEIAYGKRDIKIVLRAIGEAQNLSILTDISDKLYDSSLKNAFVEILETRDTYISKADNSILITMAEELGKTNTNNQLKSIAYAKCRLEEAYKSASAAYAAKGQLYRSLGVLVGTMAVIILL